MLLNWNKLRKRIYDKQDIALFDEVVKCYKGRAYRMAYIGVWICIAESLRNKISIMAQRDSVADEIMKLIEKQEKSHYPPDRIILNKSREIGILDETSYLEIEHILNMRNIYAHPYNVGPTPRQVELAIITAVDKVLSIPPLLRKPYLDRLLKNLQENRHFIDDVEEKVVKFTIDVVDKISPHLYPYTFKGLIYRLNMVIDDPDKKIFRNRLIWFVRAFIKQIKPNFSDPEWSLSEKFNDFPEAITKVFSDLELWGLIPENIQDGILGWLLYPEEEAQGRKIVVKPPKENIQQVFLLFEKNKLTERQKERFLKWIEEEDISYLCMYSIPFKFYIDKVIEALSSYNWYIQNPAADCVWNLGPEGILEDISSDKLEQLGRNILQAADGGAIDCILFLKNTLSKNVKWPIYFVKGILYECFLNEKLEFRCKYECLSEALLLTIRCCMSGSEDLLKGLLEDIEISVPKYGKDSYHGEREAIKKVEEVIGILQEGEDSFKKILSTLKEKLETFQKSKNTNNQFKIAPSSNTS